MPPGLSAPLGEPPSAPPGAWTLAVIPDLQGYTRWAEHLPLLDCMADWLAGNAAALNLRLVLQEGDLVWHNDRPDATCKPGELTSAGQWRAAQSALARIGRAAPVVLCTGNHDYGAVDSETRATQLDAFFPRDGAHIAPWDAARGGNPAAGFRLLECFPNWDGKLTLENAAYELLPPFGPPLLILALEWGPRFAAVDWAAQLAAAARFDAHRIILLNHAILYHDGERYDWARFGAEQDYSPHLYLNVGADCCDGQQIFELLIQRVRGMALTFNGHVVGPMVARRSDPGADGRPVHQLLFNAQMLPSGGMGWLRLLHFLPDGAVQVRTYSPWIALDSELGSPRRSGDQDEFTLRWD